LWKVCGAGQKQNPKTKNKTPFVKIPVAKL
jgi:hypothetical protein